MLVFTLIFLSMYVEVLSANEEKMKPTTGVPSEEISEMRCDMASIKTEMGYLKSELVSLRKEMEKFTREVRSLVRNGARVPNPMGQPVVENVPEQKFQNEQRHNIQLNDTDLEERVILLEFQMAEVTEAITDVEIDLTNVEGQVTVILADQVIQDERLLLLETDTEELEVNIVGIEASVVNLEQTDVAFNMSISLLDTQLHILNGTMEDVDNMVNEIDARLSKFELNGTVAFVAHLGEYSTIPVGNVVVFPIVEVNIGEGYDGTTGTFTVPPGGDGLYYLFVSFEHVAGEASRFDIRLNGDLICLALGDGDTGNDRPNSSCGTRRVLSEGDMVTVVYASGTVDTPLVNDTRPRNNFIGFRVAPA